MIIERMDEGEWMHVSSEMVLIEVEANPDESRRERAHMLLPESWQSVMLTAEMFERAAALEKLGFKAADAMHIAAAEASGADVLLGCDDRFCRTAKRHAAKLRVRVLNPMAWLEELEDATHPG
jgi:predicted nucleic acid-binding protein